MRGRALGRAIIAAVVVSAFVLALAGAPSAAVGNVSAPKVGASSYRVGSTLYADPGVWSGSPTSFSFQWKQCKLDPSYVCQDIAGATGSTHVVTAADTVWNQAGFLPERSFMFGIRIIVEVSATDGSTTSTAQSELDPTLPSAAPAPVGGSTQTFGAPPAGVPQIDGTIIPVPDCVGNTGPICTNPLGVYFKIGGRYSMPEGGTLTSFSSYFRGGPAPQDFTPAIYRVDTGGIPTRLVVLGNTFTVPAGAAAGWFTSSLTSPVAVTAGTYVLTFLGGNTDRGAVPYFYIPGQSIGFANINFDLTPGDPLFNQISLVPSDPFGPITHFAGELPKAYVTYTTAASTIAAPGNTALPGLGGTAQLGASLTVSTGNWTNSPTGFTYQWQRCDSGGGNCVDLANQVASAYTLVAGDVGQTLRAKVRALNDGGISGFATSGASPVVVSSGGGSTPPINTAPPIISGTAQAGATLGSSSGAWLNSPTSYAYQWQRCNSSGASCANIGGAVSTSLLLGPTDVGSTIRVNVTAANSAGQASSLSNATAVVAAAGGGGGGGGGGSSVPDLRVSLSSNGPTFAPGGEADVVAIVDNIGTAGSLLTHLAIALPSTMTLLGPPAADRGSGCTGSPTVDCYLDYIPNGGSAKVVFAVRLTGSGASSLTATASSDREANPADNSATLTLTVNTPAPPPPPPPVVVKPVFGKVVAQPAIPAAGKRFLYELQVKRSDNGAPLMTARVTFTPTVAGRPIAHTGSFRAGRASVSFVVPKKTKGKLLKIKMTVVSGSQSAAKTVSYKVR